MNERGKGNMRVDTLMWAVTLVFGITTGAAQGQVYQCEDEDGQTVFSGQPCGDDAQEVEVRSSGARDDEATRERQERRQQERERLERARRERYEREVERADAFNAGQSERRAIQEAIRNNQVRTGMTPSQVRESWGGPTKINRSTGAGGAREQWVYRHENNRTQYVYFRDGEVSGTGEN